MMKKAFIFDMDGVIIDSEPIHFDIDVQTMEYLGIPISPQELERFVGMTNPDMWRILKQEYNIAKPVEEIIDYQLSSKIKAVRALELAPIAGIMELISNLKKLGMKLGIASSSPRVFINEVLMKFQIGQYFDCVVSGEEVANGKPAPDIYVEAARQLGVHASECIVLEDSSNGIKAAQAANMRCIGFINPNSGNQDVTFADVIISKISEINVMALNGKNL